MQANVRLLADELADLNGSVDVYQHHSGSDDEDGDRGSNDDAHEDDDERRHCCCTCRRVATTADDRSVAVQTRRRCRPHQQMPMIAVPLKDTRPIDFGPPLEVSSRTFIHSEEI